MSMEQKLRQTEAELNELVTRTALLVPALYDQGAGDNLLEAATELNAALALAFRRMITMRFLYEDANARHLLRYMA